MAAGNNNNIPVIGINTYTYRIPVKMAAESNNTYINKRMFQIIQCPPLISENPFDALWSNNLCSQDEDYCQPWVKGDKIYSQVKWPGGNVTAVTPVLVNNDTDEIFYIPNDNLTFEEGSDSKGYKYSNFVIDTNALPDDMCCFYIQWNFYYEEINEEVYNTCYAMSIGDGHTILQARFDCLAEVVDPANIKFIVSEPYCQPKCIPPTVIVNGFYPKYDCNGGYYAPFVGGLPNSYQPVFRLYGDISQQNFSITETILYNKKKSSKQVNNWQLMTPKIPPYVAQQLAICFNSQILTINGAEFRKAESIAKNNDDGQMWIINSPLTTECDEINFTCQ